MGRFDPSTKFINALLINSLPLQVRVMRLERGSGLSVTHAIVQAVVEETGQDTMEITPLGESIDPDAIESLFDASAGAAPRTVTLEYGGCRVIVDGDAVVAEPLLDA